jgi:hypothetical protein
MVGGVLGGIGGFTGTVPTPVVHLARLERDTQRAVIQNFNLSMLMVTLLTYIGSGLVTTALPSFAVVALAMLLPTLFGTRLYLGISELAFRRIVLAADPVRGGDAGGGGAGLSQEDEPAFCAQASQGKDALPGPCFRATFLPAIACRQPCSTRNPKVSWEKSVKPRGPAGRRGHRHRALRPAAR